MKKYLFYLSLFIPLLPTASLCFSATPSLNILRITPKGPDVPAGRQVVFQFDRPVIPIGRMERNAEDIPIAFKPHLDCEWRWLNTSALACQLREEKAMRQATRYEVTMRPGITTEEGLGLKHTVKHSFTTTRPKLTYTRFINWLSPGTPLIQVTFNQPVTRASVESALSMTAPSAAGESVQVVAYPDNLPRRLPWWMTVTNQEQQPSVNDQLTSVDGDQAKKVWIVEPRKELPLDAHIGLQVKPGLISSGGPEAGIENRTAVSFDTFPKFEFIGLRCTLKGEKRSGIISLPELKRKATQNAPRKRCAPLSTVALVFTAPVLNSTVKNHIAFSPRLDGGRKDYDPWENSHDRTHLGAPHRKGREYRVWLPELLQAYEKYTVEITADTIRDEFSRRLQRNITFDFYTAHRQPNLKLSHAYAVLEKGVDTDVPLYVTNLDNISITYDKLGDTQKKRHLHRQIQVPEAEDISYALPLGIKSLLGDDTGMLYGKLTPQPKPPNWYGERTLLAQVMPFQVHVKAGHFNSLAWVSRFDDGKPVEGARVSILKGSYKDLPGLEDLDITAKTDANGLAELPGLNQLDPQLAFIYGGYHPNHPGLFAQIEHRGDIAVVPLNHAFKVRGGGVYPQLRKKGGHTHAWGTTAQGIYKLGDKVQFKIYVREQSNRHWVSPRKEAYELQVFDPQNKIVYARKEIGLNPFGAFDGEFKVPESGAVGWYRFTLTPAATTAGKSPNLNWEPMSVLISDFTPAPFNVKTELNGGLFKAGDQVEVTSLATLHSGGPYTEAEIRLTARLIPAPFAPDNPKLAGFAFGSHNEKTLSREQNPLLDIRGKLNDLGRYENALRLPQADIYFGSIRVESAVKDARGKFVSASARAQYAGRDRFIGLRNTRWLYRKGKTARLETVVVDQEGNLVPGAAVTIAINHRQYKAARVKGPGNAYLTQNIMEWVEETHCRLTSTKTPASCRFKPRHPGYYQFVATVKDQQAREHQTTLYGWVTGSGSVVWDQTNDATLQIEAEKNTYNIGDTARYLIKNPYPGAKALVTVERYGIIDSWVETLETSTPVIEVPIKPDYLPGFYLSIVALSPRVDKPLGPGRVDLGKPSYRMGYITSRVSDPYKKISIDVSTDRKVYKPGDSVKANIKIDRKNLNGEPLEIAVAVVDESVLALNRHEEAYYDPYTGFNHLDGLDVINYSLISRLLGRQKFEKKGANPGGGGSSTSRLRSLFKFVSYWNPSLLPDKKGRAEVEFEVPDNLTGWRILAFAVNPDDKMGLGQVNFKVNRPTEIRPVMPNQIIEGDEFKAGFNIMNRTDKPRNLNISVAVEGPLSGHGKPGDGKSENGKSENGKSKDEMPKGGKPGDEKSGSDFTFSLKLAPYKRENIWVPLKTRGDGELTFTVTAGDKFDTDATTHRLPVNKRRSLETASTYGTFTGHSASESVQVPDAIYTDVGSIDAVLAASVIGNLDGAFSYIEDYPYLCWEQRLTKAVVAQSYIALKDYLRKDTYWPHPQSDIAGALEAATNFQAPNGGMVYWIPSNRHVSPYLSAYTAMAFQWLRRSGYSIPEKVESRLHDYLLTLLRHDEFPSFFSKGMAASVRAVALAALAESGKITQQDIARYTTHVPEMDLFGKAHFLQAAIKTEGLGKKAVSADGKAVSVDKKAVSADGEAVSADKKAVSSSKQAIEGTIDRILGHASQSGGKVQFNEPWDDSYKYLLATPLRSNCAVLSSLLSAQSEPDLNQRIGDIPFKLVRAVTQSRGKRNHWENTQENVFCLNALIDYASRYEKETPAMQVKVNVDDEQLGAATFTSKADATATLSRPLTDGDPGRKATLKIEKTGEGRLYYAARIAYDLKQDTATRINSGIEIRREYSVERDGKFLLLKNPALQIQRGELVRVDLFVSVPTARHFVVVHDPIPGGLEPVNTDLATESEVDAQKGQFKAADDSWFYTFSNWTYYGRYFWSFYHKELQHDSARFFADYLPAGNYHLSYTAQAIAAGRFTAMPVSAEEMYDPDIYGKGLPATLYVGEQ